MWKLLGIAGMLGGMAGVLHSWVCEQRAKQKWIEDFLLFLKKTRHVMQTEKIRVVEYFTKYASQDISCQREDAATLAKVLEEMARRLSTNTYPNGQMVWEEVFEEEKRNFPFDQELFQIVVQAGNGFFGRSRKENISFLEKSIRELEQHQITSKEKQLQERKVWIPVGMLGTVMLVILFL